MRRKDKKAIFTDIFPSGAFFVYHLPRSIMIGDKIMIVNFLQVLDIHENIYEDFRLFQFIP